MSAPQIRRPDVRRLLTTLLLLVPLSIGLAGALLPRFRVDKPGMFALLCLIAALVLGGRALWRRADGVGRGGWWLLAASALFMLPFAVIARGFGKVDMLALLFHAEFGTQGAGVAGLDSEILKSSVALGLVVLTAILIANLWGLGWRVFLAASLGLLASNPLVQFGVKQLFFPPPASNLVSKMRPVELGAAPTVLPDILLIYLEGSDRRFTDKAVYGPAYAPLHALEAQALTFLNVGQIAGTGWTLAGMVASQCGVPLVPKGLLGRNNFDDVRSFLPEVTCLTDVLAKHAYTTQYIVGVDDKFAGGDVFYSTHQLQTSLGTAQQSAFYRAEETDAALVGLILDDQMIFETGRRQLADLVTQPAPFLQILATIGPHGKNGFLSRRCTKDGRAAKSTDIPRVAACTIEEGAKFIADAKAAHAAANRGRPLRIVVVSDHLNHSGPPDGVAPELYLANTVMFLDGPGAGTQNDAPGSMVDVYPTMLDWLGFSQPGSGAGLGRSLIADKPATLVSETGIETIDAMLAGDAALSALLWRGSD